MPGSRRSEITISNGSFLIRSTPSRPVAATLTWHPSSFSASAIEIRMRGSSSMIKTFGCGMSSGPLARHRPDIQRRQFDNERGPLADLALDRNRAAMPFDDPKAHRQSQARALALPFGGEERIEDFGQHVGRNSAAGIFHFDRAPRPVRS